MTQTYGQRAFAVRLDLGDWQFRAARTLGLVPDPDAGPGRWSAGLVDRCRGEADRIRAELGSDPPAGAARAAARLARRAVLDVERVDVEVLAASGVLPVAGRYRGHPVYLARHLDAVPTATLAEVVAARKGPLRDTVDAGGAARALGWRSQQFGRLVAERGLTKDRLGRYALADVRALAADEALMETAAAEAAQADVQRARRAEERCTTALRGWLAACTRFLDGAEPRSPDLATARRALSGLTSARYTLSAITDREER
ncbi:hypothetical protein BTM25_23460 [Actinomadura rubteroloni]|uniref:Uncharacterized protein n=1 Tax=Actinomadura rubteroloni TaxID=1926885 RepID=A0A2P4UFA5_9ACTN|nr:hypothetical protein [Actinomadura rubteroloni]POM23725.1 hypothetical protein BTM25_23460 [Actinomadura rubteroloni]